MKKIIRNIMRCKKCDDVIESRFTHEMVTCKCKSVAIDGGKEYQKMTGDRENIDMSLSVYEEE